MAFPATRSTGRPAVFLDRDGTLMEEVNYCRDPSLVQLFHGVPEALRALKAAGFLTVLVTNQNGIPKGLITLQEYEAVHARLLELLGPDTLDAAYMCADPSGAPSSRRKPAPGMLLEAARDWGIDLEASWIIGDKAIDIACGRNAGVRGVLVRTGYGREQEMEAAALHASDTLREAAGWILSLRATPNPTQVCPDKALGPSLDAGGLAP